LKVVLTDQSLERLEKSLLYYLEEFEIPKVKVAEIKIKLLRRAKSLSRQPYKGQYELYLAKLNQGHRRLIEGNFKIVYRIDENVIYVVDFFDSRDSPEKMKG
jgi:Txe/YoeB family toxin of Txe-Axe toxin-antitoxin module